MLIDLHTDGHVHTQMCHHAVGSMEEYVVAALDKNITRLCFLEHMEEGIASPRITWLSETDFDRYFEEGNRLRQKYDGDIVIELGVEVGFNRKHVERLAHRLAARPWDRIGLSYHYHRAEDKADHLNLVSKSDARLMHLNHEEAAAIESAYYRNLIEAVEILPGTVLCHIDAVLRHYPGRSRLEPPWPLIDELLEKLKRRGMALEINTSGFAIRGEFFPAGKILRMAAAKNITLTAGSDAHRPEDIGNRFDRLGEYIANSLSQ